MNRGKDFGDPSKERICYGCGKWFLPHEGKEIDGGSATPLQSIANIVGAFLTLPLSFGARRFHCRRCIRLRRLLPVALVGPFVLVAGFAILFGPDRPERAPPRPALPAADEIVVRPRFLRGVENRLRLVLDLEPGGAVRPVGWRDFEVRFPALGDRGRAIRAAHPASGLQPIDGDRIEIELESPAGPVARIQIFSARLILLVRRLDLAGPEREVEVGIAIRDTEVASSSALGE